MAKSFTNSATWATTNPTLSTRSLFLTITPTPLTLSARLSILRAISAHGPVDHFRSLKHHPTAPQPNAFHTIVSSKEAAERLLKSSPFLVGSDGRSRQAYIDELGGDGAGQEEGGEQAYTVEVRHSYHAPEVAVKSSPLYGSWKSGLGKNGVANNPITLNLASRVPSSIAKEGLCDWSRDSPRERRAWFTGEGGTEDSTPWRIQRRNKEEGVRSGGERRAGSGGMRRASKPVEREEEAWESEEIIAQEGEDAPMEDSAASWESGQETVMAMDPEMRRALRQVADRFGPDADTIKQNAQDREAERIEAERIAAIRAAAMERTRKRMGSTFTPAPQTEETKAPASAINAQVPQQSSSSAQDRDTTLEEARRAMKEKKARYAAWHLRKELAGESLRSKSRTEKWKMFWDEVEHARV